MHFLNPYSLPPLFSSIIFFLIGYKVYQNNKKSDLNISFFNLCLTTFIWQFTMFFLFNTSDKEIAFVLVKVAHVGIVFLPVAIYKFILNISDSKNKFDFILLRINTVAAIVFTILLFTNFLVNGYYIYYWSFYPKAGLFHPVYLLLLSLIAVRIVFLLAKKLKSLPKYSDAYYQIKYILFAVIFYTFASSDFLLNYGIEFYPFGFVFIMIFMGITAYAIIKHRLMEIKMIMRQSSIYFLSLGVISLLAFVLSMFNVSDGQSKYLVNTLIVIFLSLIFPFIKTYLFLLANKYFFTSVYDGKKVINQLNYSLRSTLDINYIYESIADSIESAFHSEKFAFLVFDSHTNIYNIKYSRGMKNTSISIVGSFKMHQQYIRKNKIIILDDIDRQGEVEFFEIAKKIRRSGFEILIPVNIKWRNIGVLALGSKKTKERYTQEDVSFLELIAGISGTAIENGFLYNNLSEKNKKLEELLQVKNEFLRIANHQLNTPLSIMRLAYSSVEEKAIPMEQGFLMAKEGVNRLSDVIAQVWTVFEIESNELSLNPVSLDLRKLYSEIINEKLLTALVKERGVKFIFDTSSPALDFMAKGDVMKIRGVFSALIDNACFYSIGGNITVLVERVAINKSFFIKTSIIDNGVGFSEEDKKNIFQKFMRGKKANLLHPDGSGIGLFVAKHVIEASGGQLLLEKTAPEKGSVFSFTLPVF